jgi:valine--pyruvate aminotransferase
MDDCGAALTTHPDMRMLGGGQPAAIPQVQQLWRQRMRAMLADGSIDRTLLNYDPPGGNPLFREAFAGFLKRECGWDVTRENIAVMPSSQSACFLLFNLLAGRFRLHQTPHSLPAAARIHRLRQSGAR